MACTYVTPGHLGRDLRLVASLHTLKHLVLQEWGGPSLDQCPKLEFKAMDLKIAHHLVDGFLIFPYVFFEVIFFSAMPGRCLFSSSLQKGSFSHLH